MKLEYNHQRQKGAEQMGKTKVVAKIENHFDVMLARKGMKKQEEIRSIEIEALIDTGATTVCLPGRMIEELGLEEVGKRKVNMATGKNEITVYGPVQLTIQGRECRVDVFELSGDVQPLIGYVPLEWLDLLVDPKNGRLVPNPEHGDELVLDLL